MATILKCPRCQQVMDVTAISPGSTVRCPDCGQNAKVPAGSTNLAVKTVSAPIPPPQTLPTAQGRGTRVRGRSSGTVPAQHLPKESSNSGLFIGLGIGAVAVIAVVVAFTMGNTPPPEPPPRMASTSREPVVFKPNLPASSDKPIVLGSGSGGKDEPKATQISKPAETVDNVNWDAIIRDLRSGGGFDHADRPEGVAFQKVKAFGKAAYPKLIKYIDDEQPEFGIAAVAVLNALTGRDSPLPKGVTKGKIKGEWEEWQKADGAAAPKPDAPKQ
ncbi:MAG: hypothetical protein EHM91_04335 [Planctomycetota bacterium]|nr:MAG: hypothetical protein EHM91_04335 [Planctomycetota bacterium]